MYIVAFNGPPECGKDTLAQMLVEHMDSRITLPVRQDSLSLMLRKVAYTLTGYEGFHLDGPDYAAFKRKEFQLGERMVTGRQIMIDVSERFLKPTYGEEVMASLMLLRYVDYHGLLLIRDSGFQLEVDPLIRFAKPENVYVVRILRDGKTFEFDSRESVFHPNAKHNMEISNNGTLDDLATEAGRLYGRLVNQLGWKL